ncbi:TPA: hypothetical protein N0F65_009497 [Lagenidium giganteum]|uniref:Uncharacterized protein n=1 Tax=Lagenidium giganteum TaxID=4803 RepID=A0AAV2ZG33_9STRA|nr:TPA: hypothetical protein N0F65_009497 [Lagenidium giganteum]
MFQFTSTIGISGLRSCVCKCFFGELYPITNGRVLLSLPAIGGAGQIRGYIEDCASSYDAVRDEQEWISPINT